MNVCPAPQSNCVEGEREAESDPKAIWLASWFGPAEARDPRRETKGHRKKPFRSGRVARRE